MVCRFSVEKKAKQCMVQSMLESKESKFCMMAADRHDMM